MVDFFDIVCRVYHIFEIEFHLALMNILLLVKHVVIQSQLGVELGYLDRFANDLLLIWVGVHNVFLIIFIWDIFIKRFRWVIIDSRASLFESHTYVSQSLHHWFDSRQPVGLFSLCWRLIRLILFDSSQVDAQPLVKSVSIVWIHVRWQPALVEINLFWQLYWNVVG